MGAMRLPLVLLLATACASSRSTPAPVAPEAAPPASRKPPREPHHIEFIEGLRVEVRARPRPIGKGWGVELEIFVASEDDRPHYIEPGPVRMEGNIEHDDGTSTGFGQGRGGAGGTDEIAPGASERFEERWPDGDSEDDALHAGDHLLLDLSMWGMVDREGKKISPGVALVELTVSQAGKPTLVVKPPRH
jgi:hypothetical protein